MSELTDRDQSIAEVSNEETGKTKAHPSIASLGRQKRHRNLLLLVEKGTGLGESSGSGSDENEKGNEESGR